MCVCDTVCMSEALVEGMHNNLVTSHGTYDMSSIREDAHAHNLITMSLNLQESGARQEREKVLIYHHIYVPCYSIDTHFATTK